MWGQMRSPNMHGCYPRWCAMVKSFCVLAIWLAGPISAKAQSPDCQEFSLSTKPRLLLDAPYIIALHSASPCFAVADALLGLDQRRYLVAYNQAWDALDTIQIGSDSAPRPFVAINASQAAVFNADVTFGTLTYAHCDFSKETPYRRTTLQTSLALPGLWFEEISDANRIKSPLYSQSIESIGIADNGIWMVIRGPMHSGVLKPTSPIERKLVKLKWLANGVLAPQSFVAVELLYAQGWQRPKRTLPRLPIFDPDVPEPAYQARPEQNGNAVNYYISDIGYVETNLVTSKTIKIKLPGTGFDPYLLRQGAHTLEYRQGKTHLDGMEGSYGRKSIYSLVGVYYQSHLSQKPVRRTVSVDVLTTRPQLFWAGRWLGIDKNGHKVEM